MSNRLFAQPAFAEAYNRAVALHERGQLGPAEATYREILAAAPDHPEALHMLGILFVQSGRIDPGLGLIARALELRPDFVDAHFNLGLALSQLGRFAQALTSLDKAVELRRGHVEAHYNCGVALTQLGRLEDALAAFESVLNRRPDHVEALVNRGVVLHRLRRSDKALGSLNKALALRPDHFEALLNKGVALSTLGRAHEAIAIFDRALSFQAGSTAALFNRSVLLSELGRLDEALADADRTVALQPGDPSAHFNRGGILKGLKRLGEALESYDRAIALQPGYVQALVNRGVVLNLLGRSPEALVSYQRAIALQPGLVEAWISRGVAMNALGRFGEAVESYDKALAIAPQNVLARLNKGMALMVQGRFGEGLPLYEARKARAGQGSPPPSWTVDALPGKSLFLRWEQGLGDTIQFCRYAVSAADAGAKVVLSVQDDLAPLLARLDPRVKVVGARAEPGPGDLQATLMSLPLAFRTTPQTIPLSGAYLSADPEKVDAWAKRLGSRAKPRVGLAWSGAPSHALDHERSISFSALAPLLTHDVEWICVQKDIRQSDREAVARHADLKLYGPELVDFSDTAGLMENLDLVVSVCSSVAHLAGALGRPTWVMLPFAPDWRWLLERGDSPWYASVRLFRQPQPGDWASVLDRVGAALGERFQA